ncbi:MAG: P-II family nitrogen regulator [Oscillospiraceae bacterium]|nr:P-II family nitrogen regulator [Oscillospiraceae bacterium]MDD6085319.1 P-II family nitrogen regulator [Oscillospiraceae bacterium]MDY3258350.1 P-II family nitrogen regulator [Ruminococcus callidus]
MESKFSRVEVVSGMTKMADFTGRLNSGENVKKLIKLGVTGVTIYNNVMGCGVQHGLAEYEYELTPEKLAMHLLPKSVLIIICETDKVDELIEFLKLELYTGHIGDGKIFVSDVRNIVRVRTGEEGSDALKESNID